MAKDMDGNIINIGDKVLVSTRASHIRRALVTNIDRDYWLDVEMIESKRTSKVESKRTLLIKED